MTANKAFLRELLDTPMLATVVINPDQPIATPASHCHRSDSGSDKKKVPTITVSNQTPYQRKKIGDNQEESTFSGGSKSTVSGRDTSTFSGERSKEKRTLSESSKRYINFQW
ncbi:uncharacterized protein [Amphiura filiformis]|uniref:uncharacterized protein n=1 Tax=Amphiura filiformis TaxID=82378 RepID=UPI003B219C6A